MTNAEDIVNLIDKINHNLQARGSTVRVVYRNGYGKVGLSKATEANPYQIERDITPLISRRELKIYLQGALDALWLFQ
jgi:hypothetical protein